MTQTAHVLIVEDDHAISSLLARFLTKNGFRVTVVRDGRAMLRAVDGGHIDLIVLDIMLPGEDGLSLCRHVRSRRSVPIIMLTALGDETDRIVGLEMGADDYLSKPFNSRELLARIRAVLRRTTAFSAPNNNGRASAVTFEGWRLDLGLRQLHSPTGSRVALTSGEFDLLVAFCQYPRRILTRNQLLDLTHGQMARAFERSIDIQVSRLRRKLELDPRSPTLITTVRSSGYFFTPEVRSA